MFPLLIIVSSLITLGISIGLIHFFKKNWVGFIPQSLTFIFTIFFILYARFGNFTNGSWGDLIAVVSALFFGISTLLSTIGLLIYLVLKNKNK